MEKLMDAAIEYLQNVNDEDYDIFMKSAFTELIIPKTKKGISNLVIRNQSILSKANRNVRYKLIPELQQISDFLDPYVLDDYENYFDNEHTCLLWIKKLLKSKINTIEDLPISSCCGILTQTLLRSNIENTNKLIKVINASKATFCYGISTIIPRELEIPSNETLIKKMSYTLREKYRNIK